MTREQVEAWIGPGLATGSDIQPFVAQVWNKFGVENTQFVIWCEREIQFGGEHVIMAFRKNRLVSRHHFVPCP